MDLIKEELNKKHIQLKEKGRRFTLSQAVAVLRPAMACKA